MAMGHDGFHCCALASGLAGPAGHIALDRADAIGASSIARFGSVRAATMGGRVSRPCWRGPPRGLAASEPPPFAHQAEEMFLCRNPMSTS